MLLRLLLTLVVLGLPLAVVTFPGPLGASVAWAHPEPGDRDGDSVKDEVDNCPDTPNGAQVDTDRDGQGDACDADDDGDGVSDARPDNCRLVANTDQANANGDAYGDACPPVDTDGDAVIDPDDNCDDAANADQKDLDGDDRGDTCDSDVDGDKFDNGFDNCPTTYNPTTDTQPPFRQPDADGNGKGTACDPDERLPAPSPPGADPGSTTPSGSTPSAAPGTAAQTKDTRKPTVAITVARRHAGVSTGDRFVVPVRCSEACSLEVTLVVDAKVARALRLGSRKFVLAKGSWALSGKASTYVFLAWQRRAGAALKRSRAVAARVIVTAKDPAGNATTASRSVTLARS